MTDTRQHNAVLAQISWLAKYGIGGDGWSNVNGDGMGYLFMIHTWDLSLAREYLLGVARWKHALVYLLSRMHE